MTHDAILIIAASEADSNLYYATGFLAPDPFIFLRVQGEKILLASDLELDRAKKQARVTTVLSYSEYEDRARRPGTADPSVTDTLHVLLTERAIQRLLVPGNFPIEHADSLREKGCHLTFKREPFFEERAMKSKEEVEAITETQRATEEAVEEAVTTLRDSVVRNGLLSYEGDVLTSESLKKIINLALMRRGCVAQHTIVACGSQACDPHNEGSGPLKPNEAIVMDVFPRSGDSRYYADMTRTVVKGKAKPDLKKVYAAVLSAQEAAIEMIRDGVSGKEVHEKVCSLFESAGYRTGRKDGRMQGFFHGTGHGLGLDVHEPPRISRTPWMLKAGHVVTVEPGLYYEGAGGVRIEDLVVVTEDGCINLTRFPKEMEIP